MADVKVTKKMVLEAIIKAADAFDKEETIFEIGDVDVTIDDIIDYATKTIEQLDTKAAKAKETAAKKKAEEDELLAAVKNALTDEYQTGTEILKAVEDEFEDVTPAKVTARLTKLCKAGEAHKVDMKVDKRKIKGYALGAEPAEDAE